MISDEIKKLDALTDSNFFKRDDDRYNLFLKYIDTIEESDFLLIADILNIISCNNPKDFTELDELLLDMFEALALGSLSIPLERYNINFKDTKYKELFTITNENENMAEQSINPIYIIEKDNKCIYATFQRFAISSSTVKGSLKSRLKLPEIIENTDNIKKAFQEIMEETKSQEKPLILNTEQQTAVLTAAANNFSVITGGPGTGKTTVISFLIRLLHKRGFPINEIFLAAPTGRAAFRIKESITDALKDILNSENKATEIKAQTIHRLLGISPKGTVYNKSNQLPCKALIIDEVSMVDLDMMAKISLALNESAKLILIGDPDQLPSVEAGTVMNELTGMQGGYNKTFREYLTYILEKPTDTNNSNNDHIARLKENHRSGSAIIKLKDKIQECQDQKDSIINYMDRINYNQLLSGTEKCFYIENNWEEYSNEESLVLAHNVFDFWFEKVYDYKYMKEIKDLTQQLNFKNINESTNKLNNIFKTINNYKILTAVKNGIYGNNNINRRHTQLLTNRLGHNNGIPIMITQNDSSKELYNGDTGIILKDKNNKNCAVFQKDGEYINYPPSSLAAYEHSFAITVHKSQGSEYEHVLMILPPKDTVNKPERFLSKEILYTGVTRAKKSVYLFGDQATIDFCTINKLNRIGSIPII